MHVVPIKENGEVGEELFYYLSRLPSLLSTIISASITYVNMLSTHDARRKNAALLIAPGFTESAVVTCLSQVRAAGKAIALVGTSTKLVHSQHGLVVRPDYSLNQLTSSTTFQLLIIPGNYECVTHLLTSPDFHFQVKKCLSQNGFIAILNDAETALQQVHLFTNPSDQILHQEEQSLDDFCQQLINVTISA